MLLDCNYDPDLWCERHGFLLERFDSGLPDSDASILGEIIFVRKGLSKIYELICIGHELGHHYLHAKCIGYRITDKVLVTKKEREAEAFAGMIIAPPMENFETEKDFILHSGLPEKTAKAVLYYWRRSQ